MITQAVNAVFYAEPRREGMPHISRLKRATDAIDKVTTWLTPQTHAVVMGDGPWFKNLSLGGASTQIPEKIFDEFLEKHGAALEKARDFLVSKLTDEVQAASR
jgi:hypothetical protein